MGIKANIPAALLEFMMKAFQPTGLIVLLLFIGRLGLPAWGATPGFTITASNVSMSDMGSGTSNFTLTSTGGFTGQVSVDCSGPDPILVPLLILPICNPPAEIFPLPANGTASGTIQFVPPPSVQGSVDSERVPLRRNRSREVPFGAGACAAAMLFGVGFRRRFVRHLSVIMAFAVSAAALASVTGCIGKGGLAMTPGTYSYVISAASATLTSKATIQVNIH